MFNKLGAIQYVAIIAGMAITPKREEAVDFSVPYQHILAGFATLKGGPIDALSGTSETINITAEPEKLEAMITDWKTGDQAYFDALPPRWWQHDQVENSTIYIAEIV